MKYSDSIKPISYLKTHASEIIKDVSNNNKTIIITHNGEAKVVVQDIKVYEQFQESLALLKILALSKNSIKKKKFKSADVAFDNLEKRIAEFRKS
jgi:prevent-host-death family protein